MDHKVIFSVVDTVSTPGFSSFCLVCAYMCACLGMCKTFSSARKLFYLHQFNGETVSPSGFDENSPVNIIDKRCPVEI